MDPQTPSELLRAYMIATGQNSDAVDYDYIDRHARQFSKDGGRGAQVSPKILYDDESLCVALGGEKFTKTGRDYAYVKRGETIVLVVLHRPVMLEYMRVLSQLYAAEFSDDASFRVPGDEDLPQTETASEGV